jgi:hypothetical protein
MFLRRMILPLTATWIALGCGKSDDNCPGLCPNEAVLPTMTISTADGAASIASAHVLGGPCTAMVLRSAGEAGVPTSYAQVQVTYDGPRDLPPLCIVEIKSRYGQIEAIAPQVKSQPYTTTCCPYGTCCPKTNDALTQRYHLEFDPPTQTVSFPPPPDGGAGDDAADAADVAAEAGTRDASLDLDRASVDADGVDTDRADTGAVDGDSVDVAGLLAPDLDAMTVDAADGMDQAIDA